MADTVCPPTAGGERTELGLRVEGVDEDVMPRLRFIPADIDHGRWLRSTAVTIPHPPRLRTVAVKSPQLLGPGSKHSCALNEDGEVVCWGVNEYGNTDVPEALQQPGAVAVGNE